MSKIKQPGELKPQTTIKVLLYGQPGIGKTTMALSSPAPLLIDCDGGVHRINPSHQCPTVQVESWQDVADVLREDLSQFKTIIIDTAGKLLDYMSAYIITNDPKMGQKDGSLQLKGYGARKVMFVNLIKQLSVMGKNIIFVAHEKEERDGEQKIVRPEIGGSSAGDMIKELDLVGYMEMIGRKRTISFDPCEKYYAKNTCQLATQMEIPDTEKAANVFMSNIIDKFADGIAKKQEMFGDYQMLMDVISAGIAEIQTPEQANDYIAKVADMIHIWDSKLQAAILLRARAKELGFIIDPKTKQYAAAV